MDSTKATACMMGTRRHVHALPGVVAGVVGLLVTASTLWAAPFPQARMIIEVNATDGDAGIQFFVDGPGWTRLEIFDPNRQRITEVSASGSVGLQGLTEFFAESAEPSFEEQSLPQLFARFAAGTYTFDGTTVDGKPLSGRATFNHNIPAGPIIVAPADGGSALSSIAPVVIDWDAVTSPFLGTALPVNVVGYQVIVERLKPKPLVSFSVNLPATVTQVTVSPEFLQANAEYRIEVLAIDASGNQTISERDFKTQ